MLIEPPLMTQSLRNVRGEQGQRASLAEGERRGGEVDDNEEDNEEEEEEKDALLTALACKHDDNDQGCARSTERATEQGARRDEARDCEQAQPSRTLREADGDSGVRRSVRATCREQPSASRGAVRQQ